MKLQILQQQELDGGIDTTVQWDFSFATDSEGNNVSVEYHPEDARGTIRKKVPLEAVPAEVRKRAIGRIEEVADELELPGEDL